MKRLRHCKCERCCFFVRDTELREFFGEMEDFEFGVCTATTEETRVSEEAPIVRSDESCANFKPKTIEE